MVVDQYRRSELLRSGQQGTDSAVTQSFKDSLAAGGEMRAYLSAAKLALVLGDTLFVHGALTEDCLDWLPPGAAEEEQLGDLSLREWAKQLNCWASDQVGQWCAADWEAGGLETGWGVAGYGGYAQDGQPGERTAAVVWLI